MPNGTNKAFKRFTQPIRKLNRKFKNAFWFKRGFNHIETPVSGGFSMKSDLEQYFDNVITGAGIWKWRHYFEIYDRHFSRFRNKETNILEIGIYSGGSLPMWRSYLGPSSTVYGVDIEPDCKVYEAKGIKIFIGDQSDRTFWIAFKRDTPQMDIVVDDGGHQTNQQIISFEELFSHLKPGGVYVCEDIHGRNNGFMAFINGLSNQLNDCKKASEPREGKEKYAYKKTDLQNAIHSIHIYPFAVVVEKQKTFCPELEAPKHGDQWQPFL